MENNIDKKETIHVVLASDDNYMKHLYVTAQSILDNTKSCIHFHILSNSYPVELNKICKNSRTNSIISFYDMKKVDLSNLPSTINYISLATYYRLLLPILLSKEITKVLYLDVDLIVRQDIQELYSLNIEDYFAAAAIDELDIFQCKRLKLSKYFNAGVVLFNLKKIREENCLNKFFEIAKRDDIKFQDQDILNITFADNWLTIDIKWNPGSVLFHPDIYCDTSESIANIRRAAHNPAILHFTGEYKPWQFTCCHPYKLEYLKYLLKTPLLLYKFQQILMFCLSLIFNINKTFKEYTVQLFMHNIITIYGNHTKIIKIFDIPVYKMKRR